MRHAHRVWLRRRQRGRRDGRAGCAADRAGLRRARRSELAGTSVSGADDRLADDRGTYLCDGAANGTSNLLSLRAADKPAVDRHSFLRAVGAAHDALGPVSGTYGAVVRTNGSGNVRTDACPFDGALVSALCPAKLRAYDLRAY